MPKTAGNSLDQHTFKKLSRLYIIALSAIALSVLISQILIHQFLEDQESDSTVVNIAGRQRMLSQKLTKETLQLLIVEDPAEKSQLKENIQSTLERWRFSHYSLIEGSDSLGLPGNNSAKIREMFGEIQPYFEEMEIASEAIIVQLEQDPTMPVSELRDEIVKVKSNEAAFLEGMDRIVNQYEHEASEKVVRLGNLELFIMVLTLLILLCEFLFIFWPAAKGVRNTIHKLLIAEGNAKKMAHDADLLSQAKEKSVKELRVLNQAMNQTLLFARVTPDGDIIQLGEKFSRLFKIRKFSDYSKFQDLLSGNEEEKKNIENLLEENARKSWQGEVKATTSEGADIWMEMSLIPFNPAQDKWEILVIAIDITSRKEAQLEIERLTQKSFEEKMNQQKLISSKIIENQENEQNRIAKDIHDGIGQMLTGLNFNLESIDVNNTEKAAQKIENLKELTASIIKGVRTATFNLMPPELSDHGIIPALTKLTRELGKLTGKNILLYDKTGFNERMNSLTEINIYRITQEAINNAIKYADSTHIIVTVSHSSSILSITIDDNGKGFDMKNAKTRKGDGGMGMTFMRERIKYINGRLFINSEPGKGTRVTLNIPLNKDNT
ncbi:type IV pili methyl-accepting chemotaxis transducer N-terminal domain-containing protein [Gramella jeungdoensis]|uniref:Oxygen sensor histidine kinase NreB n=1 Tax=Gramella jeungdoensis TaxID=708091 RepID=A0ABT0Z049_9FLAO|nr:type IV pili methyl-accepting chemotaxis transducer N-terminal domain-containing protein [Gramella jeungdoensis]MCM8569089.1 type IV pili methyl-accepting chemotaxis transducer N-terminal domain-containing protein [Gramella jeungdoensis]